jgi:hypothetical protein
LATALASLEPGAQIAVGIHGGDADPARRPCCQTGQSVGDRSGAGVGELAGTD